MQIEPEKAFVPVDSFRNHGDSLSYRAGTGYHSIVGTIDDYVFQFLRAVYISPGGKYPVGSYYPEMAEGDDTPEASWQIAERNGWATCLGSHKWKLTNAGEQAFGNALAARAAIAALWTDG